MVIYMYSIVTGAELRFFRPPKQFLRSEWYIMTRALHIYIIIRVWHYR